MGAYATVDPQTRRKMDEMLKTWKEPVPGSIDTRPVFPPDIVQPIENALIKIRTAALEAQQASQRGQALLLNRGRPVPQPHRNTPTPPGFRPGSQQPGAPYAQPPPQYQQGPPVQQSYPIHHVSQTDAQARHISLTRRAGSATISLDVYTATHSSRLRRTYAAISATSSRPGSLWRRPATRTEHGSAED